MKLDMNRVLSGPLVCAWRVRSRCWPDGRRGPAPPCRRPPGDSVGDACSVRITMLGPLAIDGRPVRGERLAAVLGELVEARGRAVSVAALGEAVWNGAPPADMLGAVQALVSRLRRLGVPVLAVAGGYRLPVDEVLVDVFEARTLLTRAKS